MVHLAKCSERNRGVVAAMQKSVCLPSGLEDLLKSYPTIGHHQVWQKQTYQPRPRSHLHPHRFTEPVRPEGERRDTVVRSDPCVGAGADLHYFCTADGRVYLVGQAEDSDLDDPQGEGWGGRQRPPPA